jgi:cytidylate kinase
MNDKQGFPSNARHVIAIDGPAGSGKSTTAKLVAARLGYQYLDTGAMYRAVTWFALQGSIAPADADRLSEVADDLQITFRTEPEVNHVLLDGREITRDIRSPEVTRAVSEVSRHRGVRQSMVRRQRALAEKGGIVAEGRDTTTVVFPDADLKIYLDAQIKIRAERRLIDLHQLGVESTVDEQIKELNRRDHLDSSREHSPLRRSEDAHVVDTSNITIDEQVQAIITLLAEITTGS